MEDVFIVNDVQVLIRTSTYKNCPWKIVSYVGVQFPQPIVVGIETSMVAVESRFRSSFGMPLINLGLESQPDASDSQLVSENQNARVCQLLTNRRDIVPDPSKKKQPKSFVLEQNFYGTATKLIESKLANAMRKSRTWWWLCVHAHAKRNLLDRDPRHVTLIYFFLPLPLFPSFQ
nr:PREDICTED: uncharacterized protein LOC105664394 [Megachile rotundata]XP_012154474.1 PREDICTED: uncharacterized protein LOC105664394 [Megachile rotundata]